MLGRLNVFQLQSEPEPWTKPYKQAVYRHKLYAYKIYLHFIIIIIMICHFILDAIKKLQLCVTVVHQESCSGTVSEALDPAKVLGIFITLTFHSLAVYFTFF